LISHFSSNSAFFGFLAEITKSPSPLPSGRFPVAYAKKKRFFPTLLSTLSRQFSGHRPLPLSLTPLPVSVEDKPVMRKHYTSVGRQRLIEE
jgi:hypothetical protein